MGFVLDSLASSSSHAYDGNIPPLSSSLLLCPGFPGPTMPVAHVKEKLHQMG